VKATYLTLGLMLVSSLALAGVMAYSAYCKLTDHPIPAHVGIVGAGAAILLVVVGRFLRTSR
jgi:hypothetical protein